MRYDDFKDMKAATDPFFLKTPKPPYSSRRHEWYETDIVHSRQPLVPYLVIPALYQYSPGIKPAKSNYLAKLLAYLECPATPRPVNGSSSNTGSDFEVDDDDNSCGCDS
ncbi:hypothetical protein PR048_007602 [Dryococelus australis]|uniref:Uncharacterized protein n=1 Tax=Dryococelus australis TaxID=614101 RepID=A0ABQ9HVN5_9NEOP|nr:hypothetical protein PR048_007602 [Dryococelus australis]